MRPDKVIRQVGLSLLLLFNSRCCLSILTNMRCAIVHGHHACHQCNSLYFFAFFADDAGCHPKQRYFL